MNSIQGAFNTRVQTIVKTLESQKQSDGLESVVKVAANGQSRIAPCSDMSPPNMIMLISSASVALSEPAARLLALRGLPTTAVI